MIEFNNFHFSTNSDMGQIRIHTYPENISSSIVPMVSWDRPDYLSVTEFARACSVTPQAIRKMISERRLAAEKLGKQHIIPYSELTRYLSVR
jgi:excisionase family DNA binding protein